MIPVCVQFCSLIRQIFCHVSWFGFGFKSSSQEPSLVLSEVDMTIWVSDNRGVKGEHGYWPGVKMVMLTGVDWDSNTWG